MLQELWDESVDVVRDSETIARINGVASQMSKLFSFLCCSRGNDLETH